EWPAEKIAIENGRWGPFIRFGKKMLKLTAKSNGEKYSPEELAQVDVEEVKKMILKQDPKAFAKPVTKKTATKSTSKKAPAKKTGATKTAVKKKTAKK
ncbi:MAG: topoisomerase C-terminal repeat-containing protein, partial [Ginsengibacter sp.]